MGNRTMVLILPAEGYRIGDYVEAAAGMGVDVVVATDAHHGLAEDMGAELIPIDFANPHDAATRIAAASPQFEAIVPIDDRGVGIAAQAAEIRRLPHNRPDAVAGTRDKAELRRRLDGVVAQPAFWVVEDGAPLPELGGPVVVKPVGLAGSIGVIRVDRTDDLASTVERVRGIQRRHGYPQHHPLLVEEFVDGDEVAVEGLVTSGRWTTLAVFDKPSPLDGPYFPETHYVTPSRRSDAARIDEAAAAAVTALGIETGPVHAEFRVQDDRVVLLELAARPIGGLCGRALRFGLADTPLEELIIRNALGEEVRGTRMAPGASGVSMIPVPSAGTFDGIDGVEAAQSIPHVTSVDVSPLVGRTVEPLPDDSTYLGFVFARADTAEAVEQALRSAVDRLEVRIE